MKSETETTTPPTGLNGIVFMRSYYEAIKELESEDQNELYNAIFQLVFENKEPNFTKKYLGGYFKLMEPTLASSIGRYQASKENGKKGGRPKTNIAPVQEQQTTASTTIPLQVEAMTSKPPQNNNTTKLLHFVSKQNLIDDNRNYLIRLINDGTLTTIAEIQQAIDGFI